MKTTAIHPDERLVTLYSVSNPMEAELVKNLLLDHDIPCQLDGDRQAGFVGVLTVGVLVRDTDIATAREVLKHHGVDETAVGNHAAGEPARTHAYMVPGGIGYHELSTNAFRLDR